MHGKKQCGNAHIKTCAFYAWEEMLIIYMGEKDAYYAWANTRWACPPEEVRILCVGRNAYNIRGKKGILCMGKKTVGMPTLKHAHFMRGKKSA